MDFYTDAIEPDELTGYARAALEDQPSNAAQLAAWLPNQTNNGLTYRTNIGAAGLLDVAEFRAFGAEPTTGRREGGAYSEGSLPPLARQYLLDEFDQYVARDADDAEIRSALLRDGARIAGDMSRLMEVCRADAIFTGKVTIAEGGQGVEVDFHRPESATRVAPEAWNDPESEVLEPLRDTLEAYRDQAGEDAGAFLLNEKIVRALVQNTEIRTYILGPNAASAQRVRRADVLEFLADEGVPAFYYNEARATRLTRNAAGEVTGRATGRITPENVIAILPAPGAQNVLGEELGGPLGTTMWGRTLESGMPDYGLAGDEPGIVVASFIERKTPVHVNTIGSAIALPVLANPQATMTYQVW